jgi:hypothetical protein
MKIFDFANLEKGKYLGDASNPDMGGPTYIDYHTNEWVHVSIGPLGIEYSESQGYWERDGQDRYLEPEKFGAEAICFCLGKFGEDWDWRFICTTKFFCENKEKIFSHESRRVYNGKK